jgi:hypothetical protein
LVRGVPSRDADGDHRRAGRRHRRCAPLGRLPDLALVIDAVGDVIEFVDRLRPPALMEERRALLETAKNGKAILIALHGRPGRGVQNTLRAWLRTKGYLLHYERSADTSALICWAARLEPRKARGR